MDAPNRILSRTEGRTTLSAVHDTIAFDNREAGLRELYDLVRGRVEVPLRLVVDELEEEHLWLVRRVRALESETGKQATTKGR
jgi:hypothetical protein